MINKRLQLILIFMLGLPAVAQATLISRLAGQAYYDDVLDITWLQNANLAGTETFGVAGISGGRMNWNTANLWITAMNADGGTGYLGINNWRLPTVSPVNGSTFNNAFSNNGTTDSGAGATGIGWQTGAGDFVSEMGYMYYVNLDSLGFCTPNGSGSPSSCDEQAGFGPSNTAPFSNLLLRSDISDLYWSGSEFAPIPNRAWDFEFGGGTQIANGKDFSFLAWAVRSGDVAAPVPEPGSVLLLGAGLAALLGAKRSKRRGNLSI